MSEQEQDTPTTELPSTSRFWRFVIGPLLAAFWIFAAAITLGLDQFRLHHLWDLLLLLPYIACFLTGLYIGRGTKP